MDDASPVRRREFLDPASATERRTFPAQPLNYSSSALLDAQRGQNGPSSSWDRLRPDLKTNADEQQAANHANVSGSSESSTSATSSVASGRDEQDAPMSSVELEEEKARLAQRMTQRGSVVGSRGVPTVFTTTITPRGTFTSTGGYTPPAQSTGPPDANNSDIFDREKMDEREWYLEKRTLYRRELFQDLPQFYAKCLLWPLLPAAMGGALQVALDRALPIPQTRPWSAQMAMGRLYFFFALQCPLQAIHERQSAWHWAFAGGMVGAFDYHMGNATLVSDFLRNSEYFELRKNAKRGDWRYLLRYTQPVHISFCTYALGAGLLARFAGVPW
ncbi:unnamed protein product [Amoebophrya sp. A25]|nr:unnamed protein product [Amoebophrya sp. A25]|eukprot:GSA25T00018196001.1